MDLLSVLLHELGHRLGLSNGASTAYGDVMLPALAAGQRRLLPQAGSLDPAQAGPASTLAVSTSNESPTAAAAASSLMAAEVGAAPSAGPGLVPDSVVQPFASGGDGAGSQADRLTSRALTRPLPAPAVLIIMPLLLLLAGLMVLLGRRRSRGQR
jgi:hypothetical protein